jgi:hypothetical protein
LPAEVSVLVDVPEVDCLLVDARRDLPNAKSFTKLISTTGVSSPIIVITTEGGLSAINADWNVDDVILILQVLPRLKHEFELHLATLLRNCWLLIQTHKRLEVVML